MKLLSAILVVIGFMAMTAEAHSSKTAKVSVIKSGKISFNGKPITLEALKPKLKALQKSDTTVLYYREEAAGDPPQAASDTLGLIMSYRLHMVMSSMSDYSDVSDDGGISKLE